jgi:hypothetical protein
MLPQAPLRVVSPPTTFSRSYFPNDHAPSTSPTAMLASQSSHHDAVRIARTADLGSTAKGIMIGIFSVLGAAGVCLIIASVIYYFRYTQQGRIFLDRLSRPGEYDDEQQYAKEEAEALEEMDDLQRTEYMRAKGASQTFYSSCKHGYRYPTHTDTLQLLYRQTLPSLFRLTFPYRNSWQYKRRVSPHGNSNLNSRSPTALSRAAPKSSSSTRSAAFKAIYQYRNKTKCTTGRPRCTTSQRLQALQSVSQRSPIRSLGYQVRSDASPYCRPC